MPAARLPCHDKTLTLWDISQNKFFHKSPAMVMFYHLTNKKIVIQLLLNSYLHQAFSVNSLSSLPHWLLLNFSLIVPYFPLNLPCPRNPPTSLLGQHIVARCSQPVLRLWHLNAKWPPSLQQTILLIPACNPNCILDFDSYIKLNYSLCPQNVPTCPGVMSSRRAMEKGCLRNRSSTSLGADGTTWRVSILKIKHKRWA